MAYNATYTTGDFKANASKPKTLEQSCYRRRNGHGRRIGGIVDLMKHLFRYQRDTFMILLVLLLVLGIFVRIGKVFKK